MFYGQRGDAMPTDEIKERLKNAWVWQKQLEADLQMLQDLRDLAEQITPVYSLAPGGGSSNDKAILGCLQRR